MGVFRSDSRLAQKYVFDCRIKSAHVTFRAGWDATSVAFCLKRGKKELHSSMVPVTARVKRGESVIGGAEFQDIISMPMTLYKLKSGKHEKKEYKILCEGVSETTKKSARVGSGLLDFSELIDDCEGSTECLKDKEVVLAVTSPFVLSVTLYLSIASRCLGLRQDSKDSDGEKRDSASVVSDSRFSDASEIGGGARSKLLGGFSQNGDFLSTPNLSKSPTRSPTLGGHKRRFSGKFATLGGLDVTRSFDDVSRGNKGNRMSVEASNAYPRKSSYDEFIMQRPVKGKEAYLSPFAWHCYLMTIPAILLFIWPNSVLEVTEYKDHFSETYDFFIGRHCGVAILSSIPIAWRVKNLPPIRRDFKELVGRSLFMYHTLSLVLILKFIIFVNYEANDLINVFFHAGLSYGFREYVKDMPCEICGTFGLWKIKDSRGSTSTTISVSSADGDIKVWQSQSVDGDRKLSKKDFRKTDLYIKFKILDSAVEGKEEGGIGRFRKFSMRDRKAKVEEGTIKVFNQDAYHDITSASAEAGAKKVAGLFDDEPKRHKKQAHDISIIKSMKSKDFARKRGKKVTKVPAKVKSVAEEEDYFDNVMNMKDDGFTEEERIKQKRLFLLMQRKQQAKLQRERSTRENEKQSLKQDLYLVKAFSSIMAQEDSQVKEVDDYLAQCLQHDQRKKQMLHTEWSEKVFNIINNKIANIIASRFENMTEKKLCLYEKFLDIVNRRGSAYLDTFNVNEYNPMELNPRFRPPDSQTYMETFDHSRYVLYNAPPENTQGRLNKWKTFKTVEKTSQNNKLKLGSIIEHQEFSNDDANEYSGNFKEFDEFDFSDTARIIAEKHRRKYLNNQNGNQSNESSNILNLFNMEKQIDEIQSKYDQYVAETGKRPYYDEIVPEEFQSLYKSLPRQWRIDERTSILSHPSEESEHSTRILFDKKPQKPFPEDINHVKVDEAYLKELKKMQPKCPPEIDNKVILEQMRNLPDPTYPFHLTDKKTLQEQLPTRVRGKRKTVMCYPNTKNLICL
eukprot:Nk52_evm36s123 gene=Nk52_evmTU36s123